MPPKKTYRSKKSYPDSFRTRLGEISHIYTTADLRAMVHEMVDQLEAAGVTHVKPVNLYVSPVDAKGKPIVRLRGEPLEEVTILGPYRSAAAEHGL
jgi:hypothetical protein